MKIKALVALVTLTQLALFLAKFKALSGWFRLVREEEGRG